MKLHLTTWGTLLSNSQHLKDMQQSMEEEFQKWINIEKVEEMYSSIFVGGFPIITAKGQSDNALPVFYNPSPDKSKGHQHYFLLMPYTDPETVQVKGLAIASAAYVENLEIIAVQAENGQILYSKFQHDFQKSDDGTAFIDGGFLYCRYTSPNGKTLRLKVQDGKFVVQSKTSEVKNDEVF